MDVIEVTTGGWMSRLRLKLDELVQYFTPADSDQVLIRFRWLNLLKFIVTSTNYLSNNGGVEWMGVESVCACGVGGAGERLFWGF